MTQIQNNKILDDIGNLKVSVIIPMYNEEESIQEIIKKVPEHQNIEVIVVDDGSHDNSVNKVKELEKARKIKLIVHSRNKGYGHAIRTGFKNALDSDIVVTIDSDGQHNPKEIPRLIRPILLKKADIVIGSRYLGRSNYIVPFYTRLGEIIIEKSLNILYHHKIRNNQSGFRAFNKKSVKLFQDMLYYGMAFTTEILFKAGYNNLTMLEVPIILNPREYGKSRVNIYRILKSIGVCIFVYAFKKKNLDFNKLFLKRIFNRFYLKFKVSKVFS